MTKYTKPNIHSKIWAVPVEYKNYSQDTVMLYTAVAVTKILIFFAFLTLIHFLFFNCVGSVNHQYQMSCSTFSFLHVFHKKNSGVVRLIAAFYFFQKFWSKMCCEVFLWIQDFIILGTQDPGILRS